MSTGTNLLIFWEERTKNFPRLRQLQLSLQVTEAVAQHRDLKPQNIMVPEESEDLKIFDFGCRVIHLSSPAGHISLGSYLYNSPEQEKGQQVDHQQSDIYSLAIIFLDFSLQPHSA